jgi:hypothetical protein
MNTVRATWVVVQFLMQHFALGAIVLFALGLSGYSLLCAFGEAPWLYLPLQFGQTFVPDAGMAVQLGFTALALAMCFYLPMHGRILRLETSHRSFQMGMRDVARAYAAAHRADREGVFTLSSEFDSIRERIAFLRSHPDLDMLEPDVMELAAQMSHVSGELARTYSDANIARARDFLTQRQEEIADFEDRVRMAKSVAEDLQRWNSRVELEESVARSQLDQLRAELEDILPELRRGMTDPVSEALDRIDAGASEDGADAEAAQIASAARAQAGTPPDINDESQLYADDDRIVALLARRAQN